MTSIITLEEHAYVRQAFEAALDRAVPESRIAQLGIYTEQEEQYLRQEVDRMLWEPKLPNAGDQERKWLTVLRDFARDESLVTTLRLVVARYAEALEKCLPAQERIRKNGRWIDLPGCYYVCKRVTLSSNRGLFQAATQLWQDAAAAKDYRRKWLADFLLAGLPQPVSNFRLDCLYLLRRSDGSVTRLVRLINTKGECSAGLEIGGAVILPNDMGSSAEKFRLWVQSQGNFTWGCEAGAGNAELQLLQLDVTEAVAFRTVHLIEYCGWHELNSAGQDRIDAGHKFLRGLWFFDDCAITPEGTTLLPDADRIYWYDGEGYAHSRKGRELDFIQGRPKLKPEVQIPEVEFDTSDWDKTSREIHCTSPLAGFFREVCRRFSDSAGGPEGLVVVGALLGYAAAPEIYATRNMFPSVWISGQMGSGKTVFTSWAMALQGFRIQAGMGITSKNVTAVGIACQLENYSNLAFWLDEFRQHQIAADKEPLLRDSYSRQLAAKWTPDGKQRVIRTMPLVSGESTSGDAATRSRYPHILLSEQRRLENHFDWMQEHHEYFFFFWRELLIRRREFVTLALEQIELWMKHPELKAVSSRDRITHAVAYAALMAASVIFESHDVHEIADYRRFLANHAMAAAADVASDVNANVLIEDVITAYEQDAIPSECLRVKKIELGNPHPPGAPGQTALARFVNWDSYELYLDPAGTIAALQIWLRRGGSGVTLRKNDYRDQLSKFDFWIKPKGNSQIIMRMGKRRTLASKPVWGIAVDKHPLGYRPVSDTELAECLQDPVNVPLGKIGPVFKDGDPRKGPLFGIIERWLAWDNVAARDEES